MLRINIPGLEFFDDDKQEFIQTKDHELCLEHSLVSLSKWESKWHKPFISDNPQYTREEFIDYIRCMTITQNVDPTVYDSITNDIIDKIYEYINAPMTATWFTEETKGGRNGEKITNELIYYWMIALNIPFECQKWHLNRLLTLIKVCNIKNQPPKRRSKREQASRFAALNRARRKQHNTRG